MISEDDQEKEIIKVLDKYGVTLLDKDILEKEIEFSPNREMDYDKPIIYNLLFCEDIPSWK